MSILYIIGNGFDRHHGFATRYQDFAKYLEAHNEDMLQLLYEYYFIDSSDDLWAEFEENLANLDQERLLDDLSDYLPNISSDDFRDRDWHSYSYEVATKVGLLTNGLCEEFRKFIKLATVGIGIKENSKLTINQNSQFLSFNYSDTLERHYSVPDLNITYIHGKADDVSCDIILGHGSDPEKFKIKPPEPPVNLSNAELEKWYEQMSDNYDYAYEQGVEEVYSYFLESFKNTAQVIGENSSFFSSLSGTKSVYILGHSLSDIDIPYFVEVHNSVSSDCHWYVSYFTDSELEDNFNAVCSFGIHEKNIKMVKLAELV